MIDNDWGRNTLIKFSSVQLPRILERRSLLAIKKVEASSTALPLGEVMRRWILRDEGLIRI